MTYGDNKSRVTKTRNNYRPVGIFPPDRRHKAWNRKVVSMWNEHLSYFNLITFDSMFYKITRSF